MGIKALTNAYTVSTLKFAIDVLHRDGDLSYGTIQALILNRAVQLDCKTEILEYIKQKGVACIVS